MPTNRLFISWYIYGLAFVGNISLVCYSLAPCKSPPQTHLYRYFFYLFEKRIGLVICCVFSKNPANDISHASNKPNHGSNNEHPFDWKLCLLYQMYSNSSWFHFATYFFYSCWSIVFVHIGINVKGLCNAGRMVLQIIDLSWVITCQFRVTLNIFFVFFARSPYLSWIAFSWYEILSNWDE